MNGLPKTICQLAWMGAVLYCLLGCNIIQFSGDEEGEGAGNPNSSTPTAGEQPGAGGGGINVPNDQPADAAIVSEERGAAVASDVAGSYLHLPPGVEAAGPPVYVQPVEGQEAVDPTTVQMTLVIEQGMALTQDVADNLVVMYQISNADGETIYGLIPQDQLTINGNTVTFFLRGFGNYQAAILPELVSEEIVSDPTTVPILSESAASALPPVSIAAPVLSFNVADRSVSVGAAVSPPSLALGSCVTLVDEDRDLPFDYSASSSTGPSFRVTLSNDLDHALYSYVECFTADGRVVKSGWSSPEVIPAVAPEWANAIDAFDVVAGQAVQLNLAADRAASYQLLTNEMNCDDGGYWAVPASIGSDGLVSGTPSNAGSTCNLKLQATNSGGTIERNAVVRVWSDPSVNFCDSVSAGVCTVSGPHTVSDRALVQFDGDMVIAAGGALYSNIDQAFTIKITGDLTVTSGGVIHANLHDLQAQNITIASGGAIHADGLSSYTGQSPGVIYDGTPTGQGAPHGADGGQDTGGNPAAAAYGLTEQPLTRGARGEAGVASASTGGYGGGAIRLSAVQAVTVNGSLRADGAAGSDNTSGGGGGSGGSIWITTATFAGSGSISANGGNGGDSSVTASGAGGAGGRIALYRDADIYGGSPVVTEPGNGGGGSGSPGNSGNTGTIHTGTQAEGQLRMIFNTNQFFNGDLSGLRGADALCVTSASLQGLIGRWQAVLSDSQVAARDRIRGDGAVIDRQHNQVTASIPELWLETLSSPVQYSASGAPTTADPWTGSLASGELATDTCNDWIDSTNILQGQHGDRAMSNGEWLASGAEDCDNTHSLICIEVP